MSHSFTRAQLYQFVWFQRLRTFAKPLGVSDVAIAKRCRQANIPLPGLGYWAKKEAGKAVFQAALPQRALGQSDEIVIGAGDRYGRSISDEELINMAVPAPLTFDEDLEAVRVRARKLAAKVRPSSLGRPHPIVAKILEQDEARRVQYVKYKSDYYAPIFDAPNEKRRLRVLNSLLNALSSLGYKCTGRPKDGYQC